MNTDNKQLIPLAIVVAGALVAGAIYFGGSTGGPSNALTGNTNNNTVTGDIAPVTSKDHIIGDPNAKVVIIEYSDTECPFCKIFHNTMLQVMNDYEGKSVAWVYRHFPIAELHAKAGKEAEATECAAELGGNDAFWAYINRLFELTNSNDSLDLAELPRIAASIGLDVGAFNECLSSGKYAEAIKDAVQAAVKAGARGTPYSVIISGKNKVEINGAQPIERVKAAIDSLL
ncbi:MAG: thioredoxin domain-containing protein [Parcubacteria group bacterium]